MEDCRNELPNETDGIYCMECDSFVQVGQYVVRDKKGKIFCGEPCLLSYHMDEWAILDEWVILDEGD